MTPREETIVTEIQKLIDLKHPRLVINVDRVEKSFSELRQGGVVLNINLNYKDDDLLFEAIATALARTYDHLDELDMIKNHEINHPDFKERIYSILRWNNMSM